MFKFSTGHPPIPTDWRKTWGTSWTWKNREWGPARRALASIDGEERWKPESTPVSTTAYPTPAPGNEMEVYNVVGDVVDLLDPPIGDDSIVDHMHGKVVVERLPVDA